MRSLLIARSLLALGCSVILACGAARAQQPAAPAAPPASSPPAAPGIGITAAPAEGAPAPVLTTMPADLPALKWLEGCWQGTVNQRTFREVWMPQRGEMMLGVSQTVMQDKTIDYEYLRLERRASDTYYVISTPGKPERAFKLGGETVQKESDVHGFMFDDPAGEFPQHIVYRRTPQNALFVDVSGKSAGTDRNIVYPMRRINCETGEAILKQ
jgi:hypothetical protein